LLGVSSSPRPRPAPTVAVLADTDSRWKWAVQLSRRLHPAAVLSGYQLDRIDPPSPRQLAAAGIEPELIQTVTPAGLLDALATDRPDVLVIALPGGGCLAMLHLLAAAELPNRPLVVTGYVGVVYEKVAEGLLMRAGSDVIAANSPWDLDRFQSVLTGAGVDPGCLALTRLPFLGEAEAESRTDEARRFTVAFAGQPGVPGPRAHRLYLVERLAQHARRHPERDVLIKLRSVRGERITHKEPYPYDELVRRLGADCPPNLKLSVGDMGTVLNHTDLLVTVSSTAAAESIHRGVPTALLTDFGIRESLGNTYFLGSGCLASFDDLDAGVTPQADERWARRHGLGTSVDRLPSRVAELLGAPLPPLQPFITRSNARAMLPALLGNYGVRADGRPLVDGETRSNPVRKAVSNGARSMYRQGANVVAPALRKLAAL
jgi:hypothetical protein